MKRDEAFALFEAWEKSIELHHLGGLIDQESAFLSGIAAGLREGVETGERLGKSTGIAAWAVAAQLRASLKELEAGT